MRIQNNRLSAEEILVLIQKQWASTSDIQKIGSIGYQNALAIRKKITSIVENENYRLPYGLVPMAMVVQYLKIDINYLKKVSKK